MANTIKDKAIELVNEKPGIKMVKLVLELTEYNFKNKLDADVLSTIEKLIEDGEIVELEYILLSMEYRCKSLLFPKGTRFLRKEPK